MNALVVIRSSRIKAPTSIFTSHDSTCTPSFPRGSRLVTNAHVSLFTHTHGDRFQPPGDMPAIATIVVPRTGTRDGRTRPTRDRRARERANERTRLLVPRDRRVSATTRDDDDGVASNSFIVHPKNSIRSNATMTSSKRFRAMMGAVFVACALALVASPLGADAARSNVVTRVPDSTYTTPGYEGPSTTGQGRCAYPQTSTNYFEHMGPDYCRGSSNPPSGARCDLQGRDVCEQFTWEYKNYKYNVRGEEFKLPEPFTGIPRVDPRNNEEYVGQMEFTDDYISSIIGQALPGIIIACLLLVSMILVLIFYVLSSVCKCCGMCRCCFRPVPYTRKSLHVAKGIQLLFVLLCFCGCVVIYVKSPDLGDGIKSIASGLSSSASRVVSDVESLRGANITTYGGGSGSSFTSQLDSFVDAAKTVEKEIMNTENLIDSRRKDVQTAADVVAGVLLGVAFITMALSILNFWRLLIIFSVLTSIILILTWLVVGTVAAFGVFLDDFCVTINQYLIDPASVTISKQIPCLSPSQLVQFGSEWRAIISITVDALNNLVSGYNGVTTGTKKDYVCPPYEYQELGDLCGPKSSTYARWANYDIANGDWVSPFWNDEYVNYVCEEYYRDTLTGLTDTSKVWPKWDCSVSGGFANYSISGNSNVNTYRNSTKKITDSLGSYYVSMSTSNNPTRQLTVNTLVSNLETFASLDTTYNSLLKCEFVSQILSSISPGCNDTVDAVHMLWRGFIVTAVGYLCLWITMLVTIGRMANADLMIDGGNFDAKKAGLV